MDRIERFATILGGVAVVAAAISYLFPSIPQTIRWFALYQTGLGVHYIPITECISKEEANNENTEAGSFFDIGQDSTIQDVRALLGRTVLIDRSGTRVYDGITQVGSRSPDLMDFARDGDLFRLGGIVGPRECTDDRTGGETDEVILYVGGLFTRFR